MKAKTSELKGAALDLAVARIDPQCAGMTYEVRRHFVAGLHDGQVIIVIPFADGYLGENAARQAIPFDYFEIYRPSRDWGQGGPIIELKNISLCSRWRATIKTPRTFTDLEGNSNKVSVDTVTRGETALIAAMRCYVSSKLGNEVDIPDELI